MPESNRDVQDRGGTLGIVGPGKVGMALATCASKAGWRIGSLLASSQAAARQAAGLLGLDHAAGTDPQALTDCDLVVLSVRDDQIRNVADDLARRKLLGPGSRVAHCSGALSSRILESLAQRGVATASMHPLQTFPSSMQGARSLPGTYFFCEGSRKALGLIRRLVQDIAGVYREIETEGKCLYHAAAVMACNYLTALLDVAGELASRAGIDRGEALQALGPLVRTTVENTISLGPAQALTGPIARGDLQTVRNHLDAMASGPGAMPRIREIYRALGLQTLDLAGARGQAPRQALEAIARMLDPQSPEGRRT
jgi:predicted short-subunit dehydrogenase-like oxidoreductase (DUF2520 family)